jgi:hypothetical protein
VRGKVLDMISYSGVSFATVKLSNPQNTFGAATDEQGKFLFKDIPLGRYQLMVSCVGYYSHREEDVLLEGGKEIIIQIQLKPSSIQLEDIEIHDKGIVSPRLSSIPFTMESGYF